MSKFYKLEKYLRDRKENEFILSFEQMEQILGFRLADSAYKYQAYWSPTPTHTMAVAVRDCGYSMSPDLYQKMVRFYKLSSPSVKSKMVTEDKQLNSTIIKRNFEINKPNYKDKCFDILDSGFNGRQVKKSMTENFVDFCKTNLELNSSHYAEPYRSLSVCIIDCVYSLRAKYFSVTVPVVKRYADKFMNGDRFAYGDTVDDLMRNINSVGGYENFAEVLGNRQKIAGRLKSQICYDLAKALRLLKINTKEDFQNFESVRFLENIIKTVKGIGPAGLNYLFMLAGDPNRCKPDVHIHRCIRDACGSDVSDEECQTLLTNAVTELKTDYPNLTVALLDSIIWQKYQVGTKNI